MTSVALFKAFAIFISFSTISASPVVNPPTLPTNDSFYQPPPGYQNASPGDILGSRVPPSPLAAFGTIPLNLKSAHQIQYRTTDSQGNPEVAITTVLVPKNANISRLVSFQEFEDSSWLNCAPSYALQEGTNFNTTLSKSNYLFEGGLLEQGYIINIPDYEGPQSAFAAGPQAGMATLDSIRAVLKSSSITGIASKDVTVTMWGYSGGSIPTEWAAEMQPSYAPELKIAGAAIGGTISNLNNTILTMNKGFWAGFGPAGILGLYHAYQSPELTELLINETFPENRTEFLDAQEQCGATDILQFAFQDISKYFRTGLGELLNLPQLKELVETAGIMGKQGTPQIPLYFYKAVGDEIDPVSDNDALVNQYCANNVPSLQYSRNEFGEHLMEAFLGAGGAVAFLKDRFNGVKPPAGCHTEDVFIIDLDEENLAGFGDIILGDLTSLMWSAVF